MANISCNSCETLRQAAPNFVIDGLGSSECTSLKNNTGLDPSSGHKDCADLEDMNDCLVGNMEKEVDAHSCDWKKFAKQFIGNLWTTLKGIICAICGIWTNIENLWTLARKLECMVDYMMNGASFSFGETSTDTNSYIVAGKGVSFANVSASGTASDVAITYIAGGVARVTGSCLLYTSSSSSFTFQDRIAGYNYDDNGVNPVKSATRKANDAWNGDNTKPDGYTSELLYEIRIKKSDYPQLGRFFQNIALNADGGAYHASFVFRNEGSYAAGQHGSCDSHSGDPVGQNDSRGHLVPEGWMYIQCRITWVEQLRGNESGRQITPNGLMGVRMNQGEIDC